MVVYIAGITGIITLSCSTFLYLHHKRYSSLSVLDLLFFLYLIYTLINSHSPLDFGNCIKTFSIAGIWWCVRQHISYNTHLIAVWAVCSGVGQTLIGILQIAGITESRNSYFAATGTFNNPGIWGGYLAIMLALTPPNILTKNSPHRIWVWIGSGCIAIGLFLSNSRAAWMVVTVTSLVILWQEKLHIFTKKKCCLLIMSILVFPIIVYLLYLLRPTSIDARWHIGLVGFKMFSLFPFWGVGTGGFSAHYMLLQADFLSTATSEVQRVADDNLLAFNEPLLILCEQGCIGFILFGLLVFQLVRILLKSTQTDSKKWLLFPLITMCVFSLFSYFSSIWGLLVFLPFFVTKIPAPTLFSFRFRLLTMLSTSLSCGLLIIILFYISKAHIWINHYGDLQNISSLPPSVDFTIRHDAFLVTSLCESAHLLADHKMLIDYAPVMESFHQTAQWKFRIGESYETIGRTKDALHYYQQAHCMKPGLLLPLYAQFSLYRNTSNTSKAKQLAQQILRHTPKIENKLTYQMKNDAKNYLLLSQP